MKAEGPEAKVLLADRGYDSDHIRETLEEKGATPVIPTRQNRKVHIPVDGHIYALRNRIDIDQAWRLSRFCGRGGGAVGEPRRRAAPMRRRRADRLQRGDRLGVGAHQLGTFRAAANVSTG